MRHRRAELAARLAARTAKAAEDAAVQAAAQAAAAREQSEIARAANRRTIWIIVATFCAAVAAVAAPLIISRYEEHRRTQRTFESQIEIEVSIAERLKDAIESIPQDLGPASGEPPERVRRLAQNFVEEFQRIDETERQHELTQGRDSRLADVYLARRQVFARIRRMLVGAVTQAEYAASRAGQPGHYMTVNWVFSATNATMANNRYVSAIQIAADSRQVSIPNDLWMISPDFTGPMVDDSM